MRRRGQRRVVGVVGVVAAGALAAGLAGAGPLPTGVAGAATHGAPRSGSTGSTTTTPAPQPAAAGAQPPLVTSLLSPRRLPEWLASAAARTRLGASVASVLSPAQLGSAAGSTCALVTQGGKVLASEAPTHELIPASNMKLLTATAALDKLGPDFEYTTRVLAQTAPVGGVVNGNLYLVGSGDPMLRTAPYVASLPYSEPVYTSLAQLAAQVRAEGIIRITGSVIGDESYFDTERTVPTWKAIYTEEGDVGPLSALDVNDGFVLTNGYYEAAPQPAEAAAAQFATLLEGDGVAFGPTLPPGTPPPAPPPPGAPPPAPPAGAGVTPAGAVAVTSINSAPLSEIVQTILRASDDTGAELLTKELGARFGGAGTTAAGLAVIRADLAADGLPVSQLVAADGSGLDRSDRVTCRLIVDDLAHEGSTSVLAAGLPVAGRTGTLDDRLAGPSTSGRILAKTGTLDDVSALSGFVLPPSATTVPGASRAPIVFAFIMNGLTDLDTGVTVGDNLATALAAYPQAPPESTLGPQ